MTVHETSRTTQSAGGMAAAAKAAKSTARNDFWEAMMGISQGLIWVVGIAVLAWQDWWWPGIMILTAISMVTIPFMVWYSSSQESTTKAHEKVHRLHTNRAEKVPSRCVACGAPLSATTVLWRSDTTAACPYCDTGVTTK